MTKPSVDIRLFTAADLAGLEELYPAAFPEEDLLPLVRELHARSADILSLVALADGEIIGHVSFTRCGVEGSGTPVALLAPLAVAPGSQRRGIGGALVGAGFDHLKQEDIPLVLVLGDPAYYGRFGFQREEDVSPPYPMPAEWRDAWQSCRLIDVPDPPKGTLDVPTPWQSAGLWGA